MDTPSCFQHVVNTVLVGLIGTTAHVYLDDIVVQGTYLQKHMENLEQVLERLRAARLRLKLEKCEFFKAEVEYLDHVICSDEFKPQPSKMEAIKLIPVPKTARELQSFLGMINYYRKFIQNYSLVARPLTKLLSGKDHTRKMTKLS